jgi:hypothetical protein
MCCHHYKYYLIPTEFKQKIVLLERTVIHSIICDVFIAIGILRRADAE